MNKLTVVETALAYRLFSFIFCCLFFLFWTTAQLSAECLSGDCINGYGSFIYENGEKYTGSFKNEKKYGEGTLFSTNGDILKDGEWADDELVSSKDNEQYEEWKENAKEIIRKVAEFQGLSEEEIKLYEKALEYLIITIWESDEGSENIENAKEQSLLEGISTAIIERTVQLATFAKDNYKSLPEGLYVRQYKEASERWIKTDKSDTAGGLEISIDEQMEDGEAMYYSYGIQFPENIFKEKYFTQMVLYEGKWSGKLFGRTIEENAGFISEDQEEVYCNTSSETKKCAPTADFSYNYLQVGYLVGLRSLYSNGGFRFGKLGVGLSLLMINYDIDLNYCHIPDDPGQSVYTSDGGCVFQKYAVDKGAGTGYAFVATGIASLAIWRFENLEISVGEIEIPLEQVNMGLDKIEIKLKNNDPLYFTVASGYYQFFKVTWLW